MPHRALGSDQVHPARPIVRRIRLAWRRSPRALRAARPSGLQRRGPRSGRLPAAALHGARGSPRRPALARVRAAQEWPRGRPHGRSRPTRRGPPRPPPGVRRGDAGRRHELALAARRQAGGGVRIFAPRQRARRAERAPQLRWSAGDVAARGWQLDGIGLASAETEPGEFDDETDRGERLWGAYAAGPVLGDALGLDCTGSALRRDDSEYDQGTHNERRRTVGTRIWGAPGAWDYNFELVYQWGSFGSGRHRGVDGRLGYRIHAGGVPDAAALGTARERHERRSQTHSTPTSRRSIRCSRAALTSARRA